VAFGIDRFKVDRFPLVLSLRETYVWRLTSTAVGDFIADDCPTRASVIAYATLLSLFPLLLLLLTVVGYLITDPYTKAHLVLDVASVFPGAGPLIQDTVDSVVKQHDSTTIFATLALFWAASGAFNAMNRNVNAIWRVPKERSFIKSSLLALFMVIVVAVVFLMSLGFSTLVQLITPPTTDGLLAQLTMPVLGIVMPAVITIVLFTLIYRFIPNLTVAWSFAVPGGITAGLLFEIGKQLFAFYLTSFARFDAVYGSIGAVIALLTWAYYSSNILLFGCEVSHTVATLASSRAARPGRSASPP
jgi:membrane protein